MSRRHPVVAITGSSGAGTTTVTRTFEHIFRREGINAAIVEGDSFHRYDRDGDEGEDGRGRRRRQPALQPLRARGQPVRRARGAVPQLRRDRHAAASASTCTTPQEAAPYGQQPGTFTPWEDMPAGTDLLFYEGLHGAVVTDDVNVARATPTC